MGQFFTPFSLSTMMAQMQLADVKELIAKNGFVTISEPACGAGGMILAAADVIEEKGFDIGSTMYVDAIDLSQTCFHMSYLQFSLRGIPATVRRGNNLSLEMFETAITPALIPFLAKHGDPFARQKGIPQEPVAPVAPTKPTTYKRQMNLFEGIP
jgi:hypothetical protein